MITITTVGLETVLAIEAGHNTNQKLSETLGGIPEKMGSRVSRLRKQGLVRAHRKPNGRGGTKNQPLVYTVLDLQYKVDNTPKGGRIPRKLAKTYADMGENAFNNLNNYLYPEK
jgi:hypothetical protein